MTNPQTEDRDHGRLARRVTLAQRRVLLERLLEGEQRRQQLELTRLYAEYESLALRRGPAPPPQERIAA